MKIKLYRWFNYFISSKELPLISKINFVKIRLLKVTNTKASIFLAKIRAI